MSIRYSQDLYKVQGGKTDQAVDARQTKPYTVRTPTTPRNIEAGQ
ncbi:MAG: hypothetical protein ABSF46_12345 [Terriglobia bacterium]